MELTQRSKVFAIEFFVLKKAKKGFNRGVSAKHPSAENQPPIINNYNSFHFDRAMVADEQMVNRIADDVSTKIALKTQRGTRYGV